MEGTAEAGGGAGALAAEGVETVFMVEEYNRSPGLSMVQLLPPSLLGLHWLVRTPRSCVRRRIVPIASGSLGFQYIPRRAKAYSGFVIEDVSLNLAKTHLFANAGARAVQKRAGILRPIRHKPRDFGNFIWRKFSAHRAPNNCSPNNFLSNFGPD